jgi:GH15 family glucan-1,4-alpha-glucosidase
VAAMTTSIPEAPNSGRNWDYRFCWLRDAFFVVRALNSLSEVATMEEYLRWLNNIVVRSGGGHIQPLYGIGQEAQLPEAIFGHLPGYRGQGPVRVGNQAQEHFQHDVYGNIVLGASQSFHDHRLFRRAGKAEFGHLEAVGEQAFRVYDQPDAGMWELRTRARIHTSSSLMCWAACDRLAKVAAALQLPERIRYWRERADTIRERILREAWNPRREAFVESFGGNDLDASVLLMAEVNFIDPNDARFISTVAALEKSLCDGPYMRRYEAPDDFGKPETAFNICTFWRIDALARIGRKAEAREIFDVMLKSRNPLGLLSEDTHPLTGEMWGNFPQTYSMVGLINAAVRLSARWDTVI